MIGKGRTVIGIDFGTTKTSVASMVIGAKQPNMIHLEGRSAIPTIIKLKSDGTACEAWGEEAEKSNINNERIFAEFKPEVGSDRLYPVSSQAQEPATYLARLYLKGLADRLKKHYGDCSLSDSQFITVIGYPTEWNDERRNLLIATAEEAGLGHVEAIKESDAIASYHNWNNDLDIDEGCCFLVFDFGGATVNISLFKQRNNEPFLLSSSGEAIGGKDFDAKILYGLEPSACNEQHNVGLKRHLRKLKEEFSRAVVNGRDSEEILYNSKTYRLERSLFENLCCDLIKRIDDPITKVLKKANTTPERICTVLQAGGSSHFYFVKDTLNRIFRQNTHFAIAARSEEVVALGLAIEGAKKYADLEKQTDSDEPSQKDDPTLHIENINPWFWCGWNYHVVGTVKNEGENGNIVVRVCVSFNDEQWEHNHTQFLLKGESKPFRVDFPEVVAMSNLWTILWRRKRPTEVSVRAERHK